MKINWKTDYAGIDYGSMSRRNRDSNTGIRYGLIGQNSVCSDAVNDIVMNGEDMGHTSYREEKIEEIARAIAGAIDGDHKDYLEMAGEIFDESSAAEFFESEGPWEYEDGEGSYMLSGSEVWVFKSIYYTHAQYCSPCMPGAANLDSSCENGPKAYCLGPDWFDEYNPCPYPIFRVEDDELIYNPS